MEKDIMVGGLQELNQLKQEMRELDRYKARKEELEKEESRLEKSVQNKEKSIENEINKAIRDRRAQIESTYDEQIDNVRTRQKKVQAKKDKAKKAAVAERIETETADYRKEDNELTLDGKSIFKQENIPFLYNNRLFFALYFPKGFGDFLIILLTLALLLFVIPFGIYYIWFQGMSILYLALFYICVIVIFGGLYLIIGKTKCKHREALDRVRELRRQIYENKKQQRKIKRSIIRDKDESGYGLEEYDGEIDQLQSEINEYIEQKKKALTVFENVTKSEIKEQITKSSQAELDAIRAEYKNLYELNGENKKNLDKLAMQISLDYETKLGKDMLSTEKIEQMEQIIASGSAGTIADAAAQLRQK